MMKFNHIQRLLDLIIVIFLLPFGFAVILLAGILILLIDKENPIFRQSRIGRNGKTFEMYKLRTFNRSTPDKPTHELTDANPLETGKFFRKFKLDEIPQILNVLIGNMSLVGPRPCLPTQTLLIGERDRLEFFQLDLHYRIFSNYGYRYENT